MLILHTELYITNSNLVSVATINGYAQLYYCSINTILDLHTLHHITSFYIMHFHG